MQLETLKNYVRSLSAHEQQRANLAIELLLPMKWALWMEAGRFNDDYVPNPSTTLH